MKQVKVGLVGLGTVGAGVAKLLTSGRELLADRLGFSLVLARACDLRPARGRPRHIASLTVHSGLCRQRAGLSQPLRRAQ